MFLNLPNSFPPKGDERPLRPLVLTQSSTDRRPSQRSVKTCSSVHTIRVVDHPAEAAPTPVAGVGLPIQGVTDPRWVLAVRTAEALEGEILWPEKRQRLLRLGKMLGLSVFDANLILAIVQDQARRGLPATECPFAGQLQLTMVPLPPRAEEHPYRVNPTLFAGLLVAGVLALELLVIWFWLVR